MRKTRRTSIVEKIIEEKKRRRRAKPVRRHTISTRLSEQEYERFCNHCKINNQTTTETIVAALGGIIGKRKDKIK